jgi:predicted RNA-binding Zn-ribbon protein involved in translation (DUF1610 family)
MSKRKCHNCENNVTMNHSPHGRKYCPNCGVVYKPDQRNIEENAIKMIEK